MAKKTNPTPLRQVPHTTLVQELTKGFTTQHPSTVIGIGDDAAVLLPHKKEEDIYQLVTTDTLVEQIHFDLTYFPLQHLGYKAVINSISNIIAMNGQPTQITTSVAVSNQYTLEALQQLYQGIQQACVYYQVDLIGGCTTASTAGLIFTTTALGHVAKGKLCQRKGSRPNEILCITGDLGGAYVGLQVLQREKLVFQEDPNMQPDLTPYQYMVQRQLKPEARIDILQQLQEHQVVPTAMTDIRSGLTTDILRLSQAIQLGITIYEDKLPIDRRTYEAAVALNLDPITCALHGGEDFELLFTIRQEDLPKIQQIPNVHPLGHVCDQPGNSSIVTKEGKHIPLQTH